MKLTPLADRVVLKMTEAEETLLKNPLIRKLNQTVSLFYDVDHLTDKKAFSKTDFCTRFCLFPWLDKSLPDIIFLSL